MDKYSICPICYLDGKTVHLQIKDDVLRCSNCNAAFPLDKVSPLMEYQETWKNNSSFLFALLRPELPEHITLEPGLKQLFDDCYHTLLIGRYNASIVMMGVFLEALMKERIRLKTGLDFTRPYAQCIDRLMGIKRVREKGIERIIKAGDGYYLIAPKDILFLSRFRNLRNTYTHFDEAKAVGNKTMKAWKFPISDKIDESSLKVIETTLNEIKSGKRKPMVTFANHPALRSISKFESDRKVSVILFNQIYDFTLGFAIKYLRQKDYDECNQRFPNPFVDLTPKLEAFVDKSKIQNK
jgi:hypothetical protein